MRNNFSVRLIPQSRKENRHVTEDAVLRWQDVELAARATVVARHLPLGILESTGC